MRKKNVVREHTIESVDIESGEIKSTTSFTTQKVDTEPEFIKMYIEDMSRWSRLPKNTSGILGAILRYMNYENIIPLNACIKDTIAKKMNTTRGSIDVQLHQLCKYGILTRVGTGTYLANPYVFGRGKWTEIKEIRATVRYNKDGVTFSVVTNPEKQLSLPEFDDPFGLFLDSLKEDSKKEVLPIERYNDMARRLYGRLTEKKVKDK